MDLSDTSNPSVPGARTPAGVSSSFQPFSHYVSIITVYILLFICFYACNYLLESDDNQNLLEPEMILVDEDLTFKNGPSWDSTVYEIVDSLPIITLNPYYIGKYELTNLEYYQFIKDGGYSDYSFWSTQGWKTISDSSWTKPKYWGKGDNPWKNDPFSSKSNTPIHAISYYEAEAYCKWLSVKTGKNYHIPSSLQWVRAAKGPDLGTKYPWGNDFNEENAHYPLIGNPPLVPVTSFPNGKSHDGCYHMVGNAYEICVCIPFSDEYENFPCYVLITVCIVLNQFV